jgi:hypothetical protein
MTDTDIELSEAAFAALFPLRTNHFNPGASWEHPYLISTVPTPDGVNIHVRLDTADHDDVIPSRRRRAMKAELVIADYATGDATENLTDLLTDFRHWCDEHGEDFARLDRVACRHYIAEHNDKED